MAAGITNTVWSLEENRHARRCGCSSQQARSVQKENFPLIAKKIVAAQRISVATQQLHILLRVGTIILNRKEFCRGTTSCGTMQLSVHERNRRVLTTLECTRFGTGDCGKSLTFAFYSLNVEVWRVCL